MEDTTNLSRPTRYGVWLAPIIALLWLSALFASAALFGYCWRLFRLAWF